MIPTIKPVIIAAHIERIHGAPAFSVNPATTAVSEIHPPTDRPTPPLIITSAIPMDTMTCGDACKIIVEMLAGVAKFRTVTPK